MAKASIDMENNPPQATSSRREATPRVTLASHDLPAQADVVIVGSGFAGVSAAISAAKTGAHVVVLESGQIGEGASTRNGGAVGEGLRVSYSTMGRTHVVNTASGYLDETSLCKF